MNPDPRESAAWRSFGLLTPDEADAFDEAVTRDPALERACQDIDRLSAAIALTATRPVAPRAGQLERLHRRLGLPSTRRTNWPAISGWAAAAALAGFVVLRPAPTIPTGIVAETAHPDESPTVTAPLVNASIPEDTDTATPAGFPILSNPAVEETEINQTLLVKGETKRLIQEIEVLRDKLESFQIRDRERFDPTPGMAWPIVMRMVPPDPPVTAPPVAAPPVYSTAAAATTLALPVPAATDDPPMAAMLGDALAYARQTVPTFPPAAPPATASAIPIYDSARDKGTLVVNNLPLKSGEESFNLWVTTDQSEQPIYVGRLPEGSKPGADSIDFSLGATAIVPSGFVLTRDPLGKPPAPSRQSTILLGPR
jgi:hypothetical protein